MQQTETYKFDLIEGSDPFSQEPLNQNMEKVEQALNTLAADAGKALADHAAANAAQFAALPRFHLQRWTGDGQSTRTITFPFKPDVVLLSGDSDGASPCIVYYGQPSATRVTPINPDAVIMTWTETTLKLSPNSHEIPFNYLNKTFFALAVRLTG